MKIAMFVPDGFAIRNFVLSKFLGEMSAQNEVEIFHNIPEDLVPTFEALVNERVHFHKIKPYEETIRFFLTRQTLNYAHMNWARTRAHVDEMKKRKQNRSLKRSVAHFTARVVGKRFANQPGIQMLSRQYLNLFRATPAYEQYREILRKMKPDVVFSSHQWFPVVAAPMLAAQSLGIPTATFIFSWDNLTTKGRIIVPFDHYFLWSNMMRDELFKFHPEVRKEQAHVIGTPQFDFYADPKFLYDRETFFKKIGADPNRKLICYSSGISDTHPDEEKYLRFMMEEIRNGRVEGNPQVVFRPAPTDHLFNRFDDIFRDYPELIVSKPLWAYGKGMVKDPVVLPEDMLLLSSMIEYCDLNVNICSTMTIDFAIRDKPVVNPAFDMTDPPVHGKPLKDLYFEFEHYRPITDLKSAKIAYKKSELADHINAYLKDPTLDREGRKKLVDFEISVPVGEATEHLINTLHQIARQPDRVTT